MPRLPKNTPSVFDAEAPQPDASASARADENKPQQTDASTSAGSQPAAEEGRNPSPAPMVPSVPGATPASEDRAVAKKALGAVERRKVAEDEAEKYIRHAVRFIGQVTRGSKKITNWKNVPERLRAAEAIIELGAGKNPVANQLDKGRPMLLIARSPIRPGTEHILPPDYTPPQAPPAA